MGYQAFSLPEKCFDLPLQGDTADLGLGECASGYSSGR